MGWSTADLVGGRGEVPLLPLRPRQDSQARRGWEENGGKVMKGILPILGRPRGGWEDAGGRGIRGGQGQRGCLGRGSVVQEGDAVKERDVPVEIAKPR
jgi:hypothetical protein